jgi:hypothetical protein
MSQENVEHVRRVIDLLNRGDVDEALRLGANDLVMDLSNSIGSDRGSTEVRKRSVSSGRPSTLVPTGSGGSPKSSSR